MIVMKFGGTSVQYSHNMQDVINIISTCTDKHILLVLSACRGITDSLIELAHSASINDNESVTKHLCFISTHHFNLIKELLNTDEYKTSAMKQIDVLNSELKNIIEGISLLKELTSKTLSAISSFGERMSTSIFEAACREQGLNTQLVDSRDILKINSINGEIKVDFKASESNIKKHIVPLIDNSIIPIMQGFIGSDDNGTTQVLTRGGSDYSASVFGALLKANEIQIWTDVSGIYSYDPRYEPTARTIKNMTFDEVRDLSYYGAKVLHPDTVKPAIDNNIPVRVLNTFSPNSDNTLITNINHNNTPVLNAIVAKSGLYKNSFHIPSAMDINSFMVDIYLHLNDKCYDIYLQEFTPAIIKIFSTKAIEDFKIIETEQKVESNYSIICLTGHNILESELKGSNLFSVISSEIADLSIDSVYQSKNSSLIIIAEDKETPLIIKRLHNLIIKLNYGS